MSYQCDKCNALVLTGQICSCRTVSMPLPYDAILEVKASDVKTQPHYTQFKIQPAVFIAANNLGYFEGNVIKYVCRYQLKNGVEDLKKAAHYLEMLIEKVTTGEVKL